MKQTDPWLARGTKSLDLYALDYVGNRPDEDTQIIFESEHVTVVGLWNGFDYFFSSKQRAFFMHGSPGAGTSCEVWAWGYQNAWKNKLCVL